MAIAADGVATRTIELAPLWPRLMAGSVRVRDTFCTDARCYALLSDPGAVSDRPSPRRMDYLERFLLGEPQKVVAMDSSLARSTVAARLGECLSAMGAGRQTSRVPVLLALIAHASNGSSKVRSGRACELETANGRMVLVSVERPDRVLERELSPAECSVARLLVEGKTHAEIAELRRRSARTVANQLAAVFQKLGVSGRFELVRYVVCREPSTEYAA
jgi:DNA-binding CsgD family transcriptional regulator